MIRTLVADDSDIVRRYLRTILEFRGDIEICAEAVNGLQAVSKALESRPDLIIMDLTMPVMDGFTAAVRLGRLLPEVPIVFCSIHETSEFAKVAKAIGARGYISKEHMTDLLPEAVDAVILGKTTYFSDFPDQSRF